MHTPIPNCLKHFVKMLFFTEHLQSADKLQIKMIKKRLIAAFEKPNLQ